MKKLFFFSLLISSTLVSISQEIDTIKAKAFGDSAWRAYQTHYFKKSIRLLDSAIFYGRNKSASLQLKAEAQWFLGWYLEAANTYEDVLAIYDKNVSGKVFLGMLYDKAKMPIKAKDSYASAIMLWESNYVPNRFFEKEEEANYFLALAFLRQKKKAYKLIKRLMQEKANILKKENKFYGWEYGMGYELKSRYTKYLILFDKSPKQLLEEHFAEYLLPDNIKPLED